MDDTCYPAFPSAGSGDRAVPSTPPCSSKQPHAFHMGPVHASQCPVQSLPVLSIYPHCPAALFHPRISHTIPRCTPGSHQWHRCRARSLPRPPPASPHRGQSCAVNPPKGRDKTTMMGFYRLFPNSWALSPIYCHWLPYCHSIYSPSGTALPTACSRFHASNEPGASPLGGHRAVCSPLGLGVRALSCP